MVQDMGSRILTFIFLILLAGLSAGAQDIILKKTGEEIKAIIVDVSPGVVKYKKFENQDGPIFAIAREQVDKIIYQSGKAQSFEEETPEQIQPISDEQAMMPAKPSPLLGFHMGFGGSDLYGDIEGSKMLFASTIGATFTLPAGRNNSVLFGADILSIGCSFDDIDFYDADTNRWIITDAREDLGYISFLITDRYFFNSGRNIFIEGGFYGSLLVSALYSGSAEIIYKSGGGESGAFEENVVHIYDIFDFGITAGIGGRIPLGQSKKWHITAGARFYYGLTNIINSNAAGWANYKESNIFGLVFIGADLNVGSSK